MYVEMRPIGRIFSSCNPIGLYQGYYRVHERKMRSLLCTKNFSRGENKGRGKQLKVACKISQDETKS